MAKRSGGGGGGGGGSGGESNTGLIVALIFFVLSTITLGVLTYYGYTGQTEALSQMRAANKKAIDAAKDKEKEQVQKLALRVAIGIDEPNDQQTLNGLKNGVDADFKKQIEKLKDAKWDSALERPAKTYLDQLNESAAALKKAEQATKRAETERDDASRAWSEEKKDLEAKLKKAQDEQKKAGADTVVAQQRKYEEFDDANKKIAELSSQIAKLNQEKDDQRVAADRDKNRLEAKVDNLEKTRNQVNQRIGPLMEKLEEMKNRYPDLIELAELHRNLSNYFDQLDLVASDVSKGEIVKVDRATKIVFINLGSADRLKPQLTFSVLPQDLSNKAGIRKRKGAIEIVDVLEPHLAKARIIEENSSLRDPILPGDKLFNPTFRSGAVEHVAIAGLIDFVGDGRDHTAELVAQLSRQGIVVDAWLDASDISIKGPGISEKTTYLIIGDRTGIASSLPIQEGNKLIEAANQYNGKLRELEEKAKELGVQKVTARRFLTLAGFPMQRGPAADFSSTSYLQKAAGKAAEAPKDKPADEKPK